MLFLAGAAVALQVSININGGSRGREVVRDSSTDSTVSRSAPHRLPVTAQLLATAFSDEGTRALYLEARKARLTNDSSLRNYDAKTLERMSVGMGLGKLGRDHLLYRQESAAHVRWQRGVGAHIDMTGARVAIPMAPPADETEELKDDVTQSDMSPVPYFPGMEELWIGGAVARAEVDDRDVVNPLGDGAEAYYTFEGGDSVTTSLPDGKVIRIREMRFRPRSPKWNLVVGSLYFDTASGQLVKAAYRLSVPMDILLAIQQDEQDNDPACLPSRPPTTPPPPAAPPAAKPPAQSHCVHDIAPIAKAFLSPLNGQITAIVVEYGLYEEQYWLPRSRSFEGSAQALMMRVPIAIDQSFTYARVNGPDTLTRITTPGPRGGGPPGALGRGGAGGRGGFPQDSAGRVAAQRYRDSVNAAARFARLAKADSITRGLRKPDVKQCDTSDYQVTTQMRYQGRLPVAIRVPCDVQKLINSPDLPKSIYDPGENVFGAADRDALIARALSMSAQAPMSLMGIPHPSFQYGVGMTRYNRVEGFSTGLGVDAQLGGGYTVSALGRFGFADREPNVELSGARTNLAKTLDVTAYNHLVAANDWGDPLSFGSSLRAFLFGRDEGFYYRATGAELTSTAEMGTRIDWRLFAEQERSADQETDFSFGAPFPANIVSARGVFAGGSVRWIGSHGVDPMGLQLFSDLRLEAAGGDSTYGRGALDLTASHALGQSLGASVTVSGGSSVGQLPEQRRWFLGGTETVRGQSPDTSQSGNAYWLTRAQLGYGPSGARVTVFGDLGWAGDRTKLYEVGRPLSGVGTGLSLIDGLIRFDVARGIFPRQQWRVDLYFEGRY